MPSLVPVQQATWSAEDILELYNPLKGRWTCVGHTKKEDRRCQTKINKEDIETAKRLTRELPSIADDTLALQTRLAELVRLCLCKNRHVKDPREHAKIIVPWFEIIQQAHCAHQDALLRRLDQAEHQGMQQSDTNLQHQHTELSPQYIDADQDPCAICQYEIGTNGDREALPCNHAYCGGCITLWRQESPSCPVCRDEGNQSSTDRGPSRPRTRPYEDDGGRPRELQERATVARPETPRCLAAEQSDEAQDHSSTEPRTTNVEHGILRDLSVRQQESSQAVDDAATTEDTTDQRTEGQCGICLENLGEHGASETLQCVHTFCSECIAHWRQRSPRCPYRCEL